jgi:hypothetical protein
MNDTVERPTRSPAKTRVLVARSIARARTRAVAAGIAGRTAGTRALSVAGALFAKHGSPLLRRRCRVKAVDSQVIQPQLELVHQRFSGVID